jgi:hypothetical protein
MFKKKVHGKIFGPKDEEGLLSRFFWIMHEDELPDIQITYIVRPVKSRRLRRQGMSFGWGRQAINAKYWYGSVMESVQLQDPVGDGKITLI